MIRTARLITPLIALLPALVHPLEVSAESAIAIDAGSGRVLWEKDIHSARFPASTTKIMTALLLIERCRPEEEIVAPQDVKEVGESSMNLKPGEKVSAHDMLYALMLRSANDGCYAVAKHISGSIPAFADLMNERAKAIGCTETHFANPNGLNDEEHTTSAHDLALIAREAMRYPEFREVVRTKRYRISRSINQGDRTMVNRDKLLRKDPTMEGIKTGWTIPAGHCFVGAATRNGYRVITVVLKSDNWQQDTQDILQYAFDTYQKRDAVQPGREVGRLEVSNASGSVAVAAQEAAYSLSQRSDGRPTSTRLVAREGVTAPIERGQVVGDLVMTDGDGYCHAVPVVALHEVPAMSLVRRATSGRGFLLVGGVLCGGAFWMRKRARKRYRFYAKQTSRSRGW